MKYLLLLISFNVSAYTIDFTHPTQRDDGSVLPVSEISKFHLMCWQGAKKMLSIDVDKSAVSVTPELESGRYGCRMFTVDTGGQWSAPSEKVSLKPVLKSKPKPPVIR